MGWRRGPGGKYTVSAGPAERPGPRLVVAPPSPENGGQPRQGLPCRDPRLLAKGQPGLEEAKNAGRPATGQSTLVGPPTCLQLRPRSKLASCCSSYLFPSATSFFPVALTTHCHASECAHRATTTAVPVILLTSWQVPIGLSWPRPVQSRGQAVPCRARGPHGCCDYAAACLSPCAARHHTGQVC